MKKLLTAIAITAVFASCKKDRDASPVPGGKKLKHAAYTSDGVADGSESYTYDANGRLATITEEDEKSTFNYESASRLVVTKRKLSDNSLVTTYECVLNAKGFITEILFKNPAGELTYTYQHEYDANDYLIRLKGFTPGNTGFEAVAEIINGDVVRSTTYQDGAVSYTSEYSYEGGNLNKLPQAFRNYWPSATLFGKTNKHLVTEYKSYRPGNVLYWHTKSTYQLDADGDVTSYTTNYILPGGTSTAAYQYQ